MHEETNMANALKTEPGKAESTANKSSGIQPALPPGDIQTRVAEMAYFLAEQRRFEPGCEMEDWLMAEALVLAQLNKA